MQSIDYNLNIFRVPVSDCSFRWLYKKLLSGRVCEGAAGIAVYKVKGDERFENVPETGDEKYETGEPWSKYWEDVTGGLGRLNVSALAAPVKGRMTLLVDLSG